MSPLCRSKAHGEMHTTDGIKRKSSCGNCVLIYYFIPSLYFVMRRCCVRNGRENRARIPAVG